MTQRQQTFANQYIATGNASEAYRRAYPRALAWSDQAVHVNASKMLARAEVQLRVADLRAQAASAAVATREEVLGILTRIVRGYPSGLLREDGTVDLDRLRDCRQEIGEITVEDTPAGRRHKVKLRDVVAAADRLAKLQGWDQPARVDVTSGGERLRTEIVIVPRGGGAPDATAG
jgi:hypothetical protein